MVMPLLVLSHMATASCIKTKSSGRLQWSEPATITSPDHRWQIEVRPVLTSNYNETPVSVRNCKTNRSFNLFTLTRNADLYWSQSSKSVFVIDNPTDGTSRLFIFLIDNELEGSHSNHDLINYNVKNAVMKAIGSNRQIVFYLSSFVSWNDDKLVLVVGGTTSSGDNGPMKPYCFGMVINTDSEDVTAVLSSKELRKKFKGTICRIYP